VNIVNIDKRLYLRVYARIAFRAFKYIYIYVCMRVKKRTRGQFFFRPFHVRITRKDTTGKIEKRANYKVPHRRSFLPESIA